MNKVYVLLIFTLGAVIPGVASAELVVGDAFADRLAMVDLQTGQLTEYANVGTPHIVSLAYDDLSGAAYCSDTSEGVNQVLAIDLTTGATSLLVQVPDFWTVLHSTAVDPATGELYAIDQEHGILYRVDTVAGQLVEVGPTGVYWMTGADFDPTTGLLYVCVGGLDDSGALYTVDTATGQATFVASTHRLMSLAFDPEGQLYGVNNAWYPADPGLYRIDKVTGAWEELGVYPGRNLLSMEWADLGIVAVERRTMSDIKALFN